ncbi:hypothetical protein QG37_01827 [Candidozyma auris]|nr:hypothetical protein QG37_01827 [[Candida] auris]
MRWAARPTDFKSILWSCLFLGSLLSSILQHSLDDLSLLNQESSDNSLLDTVGASRTTVSSSDSLLGLGDSSVSSWSQGGDTSQRDTTVTTLWSGSSLLQVSSDQLTTWGLDDSDLVGLGVVCLLVFR